MTTCMEHLMSYLHANEVVFEVQQHREVFNLRLAAPKVLAFIQEPYAAATAA